MVPGILGLVGEALAPAFQLIDKLHTSEAEKLEARRAVFAIQAELFGQLMAYEQSLVEGRARIIQAEAQGRGVLQRNWRPVTMLTFLVLVVCDAFGLLPFRLAGDAWTLLQIGLGGYVVGRSVEKVAPQLMQRRE